VTVDDGERLHRESFVFDLHAHGPSFLPQPFRVAWRAAAGAPREEGFDVLHRSGVDATLATAVGDPIVTRCYLGRSPWEAVGAQLDRIERQVDDAAHFDCRACNVELVTDPDPSMGSQRGRDCHVIGRQRLPVTSFLQDRREDGS